MEKVKIEKINRLYGEFIAPSDKSVSQRAVIISSIAKGKTKIRNFLDCDDSRHTIGVFRQIGIALVEKDGELEVAGKGLFGLKKPEQKISAGNSGTTLRLISGILAAQHFNSILSAERSLSTRPMRRIIEPLQKMGADISGRVKENDVYPPLVIKGQNLFPIRYKIPINSAQVKSAILLAGLYANGLTAVEENLKTRDHTERMLLLFKAGIKVRGLKVYIQGNKELVPPRELFVPGDMSSCLFFIVAATVVKNSQVVIRQVGINPTRSYALKILKRMGANIEIKKIKRQLNPYEPVADLIIKSSVLKAVTITTNEVDYCIDEIPILSVAASMAKGTTVIKNALELRVKETDRIKSMVINLKKMGAKIKNRDNDMIINGPNCLSGSQLSSFGDHRTAMSMAVAGLTASGETEITGSECIDKSFPKFMDTLTFLKQ